GGEHVEVARLDEVDPRGLEEALVVEGHDNWVFHLNRGRGFYAASQVLLGGGRVDVPRLAVKILGDVRAFGREVIADADEAPLQAGVAIVGRVRQLRVDRWLRHRYQQKHRKQHSADDGATVRLKPDATFHGCSVRL